MREQHQTGCPSETGLELYAVPIMQYLSVLFSGSTAHELGNFQRQRINLHALELALRSKRGGVMGVS